MLEKLRGEETPGGRVMDIPFERVAASAQGRDINRGYIAQVMFEMGFITNRDEAFDYYLSSQHQFYEPRHAPDLIKAAELLNQTGAKWGIAHPGSYEFSIEAKERIIDLSKQLGAAFLDVYSSYHGDKMVEFYLNLARKDGLEIVGGSDWHGDRKPDLKFAHYSPTELIPNECARNILNVVYQ